MFDLVSWCRYFCVVMDLKKILNIYFADFGKEKGQILFLNNSNESDNYCKNNIVGCSINHTKNIFKNVF